MLSAVPPTLSWTPPSKETNKVSYWRSEEGLKTRAVVQESESEIPMRKRAGAQDISDETGNDGDGGDEGACTDEDTVDNTVNGDDHDNSSDGTVDDEDGQPATSQGKAGRRNTILEIPSSEIPLNATQ